MDFILYALKSASYILVNPFLLLVLLVFGIIFYLKNRKITFMQRLVIGENMNSPLELTLSQITLGVIGGILISVFLSLLGVIFKNDSGIEFLFVISILLMFLKPRFSSFAYSGGVLGIISIVVTYLNVGGDESNFLKFDITSLMMVIGIVHIVEGILIFFDGKRGAMPVFSKRGEQIVGGYIFNRTWLIPTSLFIAIINVNGGPLITESLATPSWWPLMSTQVNGNFLGGAILAILPLFGVLTFEGGTFTKTKENRLRLSSLEMIIYGFIVCILAFLAKFGLAFQLLVIILVPGIYEFLFNFQKKKEESGKPIFYSDEKGICVLEVVPFSKAYALNLRAGDKIISLNGKKIESEKEVYNALRESYLDINLSIISLKGEEKNITLTRSKKPGVLLIPKFVEESKEIKLTKELKDIIEKLKDEDNGGE